MMMQHVKLLSTCMIHRSNYGAKMCPALFRRNINRQMLKRQPNFIFPLDKRTNSSLSHTLNHTTHTSSSNHTTTTHHQPNQSSSRTLATTSTASTTSEKDLSPCTNHHHHIQHQGKMTVSNCERHPSRKDILTLLTKNDSWAVAKQSQDPSYFEELSKGQSPEFLWIGCADSRVPPNEITQLGPGDMFVTRNIANVVHHSDLSMLSVLQYAVDVLKVKHIIVCGHHKCGGVQAAMSDKQYGLIDNWLRYIKDVYHNNKDQIDALPTSEDKVTKLVELNVAQSVYNLCHTTIVQNAWARGQTLAVHGWVFKLEDGRVLDLDICVNSQSEVMNIYQYSNGKK